MLQLKPRWNWKTKLKAQTGRHILRLSRRKAANWSQSINGEVEHVCMYIHSVCVHTSPLVADCQRRCIFFFFLFPWVSDFWCRNHFIIQPPGQSSAVLKPTNINIFFPIVLQTWILLCVVEIYGPRCTLRLCRRWLALLGAGSGKQALQLLTELLARGFVLQGRQGFWRSELHIWYSESVFGCFFSLPAPCYQPGQSRLSALSIHISVSFISALRPALTTVLSQKQALWGNFLTVVSFGNAGNNDVSKTKLEESAWKLHFIFLYSTPWRV